MPVPVPVPGHDYRRPQFDPDPVPVAEHALVPAVTHEHAVHLLNSLLAFYHQERSWVQRTRASLELAFVQGPLLLAPSVDPPPPHSDMDSDSDGSAPSIPALTRSGTSSENSSNEPTPATPSSLQDPDSLVLIKREDDSGSDPFSRSKGHGPLTLRATMPARAPSSRWLKRKQSFKLHLGPLSTKTPTRPRMQRHFDGNEPSAELLERFGELLEARMDSCMRITQLVRESNRALLHSW